MEYLYAMNSQNQMVLRLDLMEQQNQIIYTKYNYGYIKRLNR